LLLAKPQRNGPVSIVVVMPARRNLSKALCDEGEAGEFGLKAWANES